MFFLKKITVIIVCFVFGTSYSYSAAEFEKDFYSFLERNIQENQGLMNLKEDDPLVMDIFSKVADNFSDSQKKELARANIKKIISFVYAVSDNDKETKVSKLKESVRARIDHSDQLLMLNRRNREILDEMDKISEKAEFASESEKESLLSPPLYQLKAEREKLEINMAMVEKEIIEKELGSADKSLHEGVKRTILKRQFRSADIDSYDTLLLESELDMLLISTQLILKMLESDSALSKSLFITFSIGAFG